MLLTEEVIETAQKLLDVRAWKERLSAQEALKIAVEIQRNEILRDAVSPKLTTGPGQATQRINLLEQISNSLAALANSLKERN